jgi:hypothetical protein
MDFTELKAFIIQVQWGYLATTDGQVVGVRPMQVWPGIITSYGVPSGEG